MAHEIYADLQSEFDSKINETDPVDVPEDGPIGADTSPFAGYSVFQLRNVIDAISPNTPAKTLFLLEEYLATSVESLSNTLETYRRRSTGD